MAVALAGATLGSAPGALAAEVGVRETAGFETPSFRNEAELALIASPGNDDRVTIRVASRSAGFLHLEIADEGAALIPGPGCTPSIPPSASVHCEMHESKPFDCGQPVKACHGVPDSWTDSMTVQLGDGNNAFDASSFADGEGEDVDMNVTSGSRADRILTGVGNDTIDPGAGSDKVRTGSGADRVEATATPDGPDLYDLGDGGEVDYSQREQPVIWHGTLSGAPGERDILLGVDGVRGGSGPDTLTGNSEYNLLWGGPGDDTLTGGYRQDYLDGGRGNDRIFGKGRFDEIVAGPGNDRAYGGNGGDTFNGGPGNDWLSGGGGSDLIEGETGSDVLLGGEGRDDLYGREGPDLLLSGEGAGENDCGPGLDHAILNPRTKHRGCEKVRIP